MAEWTPGPWTATFPEGSTGYWHIDETETDPAFGEIATVWCGGALSAEANAHLIAAAPDMLAALDEVVGWHELSGIDAEWPLVMERIYAAITRARGDSSV